jgi:hypothetical protein
MYWLTAFAEIVRKLYHGCTEVSLRGDDGLMNEAD